MIRIWVTHSPIDTSYLCGVIISCVQAGTIPGNRRDREERQQASRRPALLEEGTLNPSPEKVSDPKFRESEFFDPRDIVQVKYEMLRRVSVENASVTDATDEYGVSRPTYYQAKANFEEAGIAGLVPKKRGLAGRTSFRARSWPSSRSSTSTGEPIRARELAKMIRKEFAVEVHPRTIERALGGKKTPR